MSSSAIHKTGSAQPGNAWPGKNNFCCFGRCVTGPREEHGGWTMFWGPVIVVGVPMIALTAWRLGVVNPLAVLMPALFYCFTLTCQCLTSCSDPGSTYSARPRPPAARLVLARALSPRAPHTRTHPPPAVIPFGLPGDGNGDAATVAAVKQVSWGFATVAELSAARIRSKGYCSKCNVHRPLGAHHCNDCGHCVFAIDHHCPVFSTCIAGRNLPHFWFAIIAGIASIVVTALSGVATLVESLLASQVSSAAVLVFVHGVALVETTAFTVILGVRTHGCTMGTSNWYQPCQPDQPR